MPIIAAVNEFNFGGAHTFAGDALATHETPEGMRPRLRGMAAMAYKPAAAGYLVRLNQATAAGAATLKLTDGINELCSVVLDLTTAQELSGDIPNVDTAGVEGQSALYWALEITSACDASTEVTVTGRLEVEHVPMSTGC